jgi:hypothetical protein
MEKLESD